MKTDVICLGSYEIELPILALEDCHHMGECDPECEYWVDKIEWSEVGCTDEQIKYELDGYGAWSDEQLLNIRENRKRILWIAAGNWQEENL